MDCGFFVALFFVPRFLSHDLGDFFINGFAGVIGHVLEAPNNMIRRQVEASLVVFFGIVFLQFLNAACLCSGVG